MRKGMYDIEPEGKHYHLITKIENLLTIAEEVYTCDFFTWEDEHEEDLIKAVKTVSSDHPDVTITLIFTWEDGDKEITQYRGGQKVSEMDTTIVLLKKFCAEHGITINGDHGVIISSYKDGASQNLPSIG